MASAIDRSEVACIVKRYICPSVYGCKCSNRPRARSTALRHKRAEEIRLRGTTGNVDIRLPYPVLYTDLPRRIAGSGQIVHADFNTPPDSGITDFLSGDLAKGSPNENDEHVIPLHPSSIAAHSFPDCEDRGKLSSSVDLLEMLDEKTTEDEMEVVLNDQSSGGGGTASLQIVNTRGSAQQVRSSIPDLGMCGSDDVETGLQHHMPGSEQNDDGGNSSESSESLSDLGIGSDGDRSDWRFDPTSRIGEFLVSHSDLLEFWLKHKISKNAMTDLLRMRDAPLKSWDGVKEALFRTEELVISTHSMCYEGHKALKVSESGRIADCDFPNCSSPKSTYSYIGVWERLKARLQSSVYGPPLFSYHRAQLEKLGSDVDEYTDFYSGRMFSDFVHQEGGAENFQHDIFLFLSGDGAQPYTSCLYYFWPFILLIGNLTPEDRCRVWNMLPILCVPGPNEPRDLVSFLVPFLDELEELSKGVKCTLWDGRNVVVRCHLFFILGDLPALARLCRLKGSGSYHPCRFCLIKGGREDGKTAVYYPSFVTDDNGGSVQLWEVRSPPSRLADQTLSSIEKIKRLEKSTKRGSKGKLDALRKKTGINGESQLFVRCKSLSAYESCPIDIMHTLLLNIAKNTLESFITEGFIDSGAERRISDSLVAFGSGVPSETRRPRVLKHRKLFKAEEWKCFVLHSSQVVFHDVVEDKYLEGWSTFSHCVDLAFRTSLTRADVIRLGELAAEFYEFVEDTFYYGDVTRMQACKYTLHLILHLEECVRLCGPVLNLSQFPMERFIGETTEGLHARNLPAESVVEQWRVRESYNLHVIRNASLQSGNVQKIPGYSFNVPRTTLHMRCGLPDFDRVVFCHPKVESTVHKFEREASVPLASLLAKFYSERLGITDAAARNIVEQNQSVQLWDRMTFAERFEEETRVTYFGIVKDSMNPKRRRNFYIAGEFLDATAESVNSSGDQCSEANEKKLVYFGKVRKYISHAVEHAGHREQFMLILVHWVDRGLKKGNQGQVFAEIGRDDDRLFGKVCLEGADVVKRHVYVMETRAVRSGRIRLRTYFVDPFLRQDELLNEHSKTKLKGFS